MKTITLAKALKLKNRIAEKISNLDMSIQDNNSFRVDLGKKSDSKELFEQRLALTDQMVELKAAISAANAPIQGKIFRIAELKGLKSLVTRLDTTEGKMERDRYSLREAANEIVEFAVCFTKADVDDLSEKYQNELDELQDELDAYNATHTIVGFCQ